MIGPRAATIIALLLLIFDTALQLHLSRVDAQTSDESVHLSAGYSYWEWGNFSLNPEHPPLVKLLAGAAVRLLHPRFPPVQHPDRIATFFYDSWRENRRLGEAFLYEAGNDADRLLFYGRVPAVLLTLLLGVAVFLTARAFFGPVGGLLSTMVFVLEPTIAAHAHLITTDIAVSLGGVAVFAAAWRFARAPDAQGIVLLGLALGLASLAKFTSVIFLAMLPVALMLLCGFRGMVKRLPRLIAAVLVGWATILAGYAGSLRIPPAVPSLVDTLAPDNHQSNAYKKNVQHTYEVVRYFGAPREYFKGLGMVLGHVANGQESFLLGQRSMTGWWYYFPVVFATKTPVPLILLIAATIALSLGRLSDPAASYWLTLALAYFACAMVSRSDLGFRHVMPAMVFAIISIGSLADVLRTRRWLAVATCALVAWLAVDFARTYDGYLPYFNELAGDRGYQIATDSNLDWGQDVKRIRAYLDRHPEIQMPYVEYNADGPSSLDYYGIRRRPIPGRPSEMSGVLIIGASTLQSRRYEFLRMQPIADRITPGVFVYRLGS